MIAVKKIMLFAVLFVYSYCCSGQTLEVPKEITSLASGYCHICNKHPEDSARLILSNRVEEEFHDCHVLWVRNETDSTYKYLLQTLTDLHVANDNNVITLLLYVKARILYRKRLYNEALAEYKSLLKKKNLQKEIACNVYSNMGVIYLDKDDYNNALYYLSKSTGDSYIVPDKARSNIFCNMASCYLFTNKPDSAELYYQKSIDIFKRLQDTSGLATDYINIGSQYYSIYNDAKALDYFKKGLELALHTSDYSIKQYANYNLAIFYENKNNYKTALAYRINYENQHDSLYNRDNVYNLGQIAVKEKEHKLLLSQEENKLQLLQIEKQKQQFYWSLVLSFVFLAFFTFALYAYRQKSKQNQIISAQREELDALNHTKDQLFSVVAHDLRSPVQTLQVMLNKLKLSLHNRNISEAEQVSGEIESISNRTYSLLNNLLYWALSQTGQLHFANEKLNACRMVEQVYYDYASIADARNVVLENRVPDDLYCSGDVNTVKIILRNLVDNAIKYSEPFTSVVASGTCEKKECIISVTNTGQSIDEAVIKALRSENTKRVESEKGQSTGIGLWLVKTMAERNGGSIYIEKQAKGTKITIHLLQYQNYEQAADTYT